jgi:transcriptional regulator with XRE-family HTH domain
MSFGKNILQIRKKAKLSQSEFAKLLKVKQPNIPRWESESVTPSILTIIKIAKNLNVTTDELLLSEDELKGKKTSDPALAMRIKSIEKLSEKNKETLFQVIDAYLKSLK